MNKMGPWPRMDRAAAFGAASRGFKSRRARFFIHIFLKKREIYKKIYFSFLKNKEIKNLEL